jgi:uncharacterized membrane protein
MHAIAAGGAQAAESAKVTIVFIAIVIVTFWRVILRLVVALIAIAVLVGVGIVVAMLMHGAQV